MNMVFWEEIPLLIGYATFIGRSAVIDDHR
jgi:hypothetical protein